MAVPSIQTNGRLASLRLLHIVLPVLLLALAIILIRSVEVFEARGSANKSLEKATLSERISIHASGRGSPWINLADGRDVLTSYNGPIDLRPALEQNQAQPLSLASGDYDEDGVPDLICGYAARAGGFITLHRGNAEPIYPNQQQYTSEGACTDSPFLSPALIFAIPESVDFIGAGDFDGDGRLDVVTAAREGDELHLLSGDGKGGFASVKQIELSGRVTAMIAGEINRRDGLDDVVVGIVAADGPRVLVFEGPEGALKAKPESFDLYAEATSLALAQLDDEYPIDLAVAAAHELIIVHGRDRKLSLDAQRQAEVPLAILTRRSFPFELLSIAVGDFTGNNQTDVALLAEDGKVHLLQKANKSHERDWVSEKVIAGHSGTRLVSARLSGRPTDNLVIVDSDGGQLHILSPNETKEASARTLSNTLRSQCTLCASPTVSLDIQAKPIAVLPMRLNRDALSDLVILRSGQTIPTVLVTEPAATFTVTNAEDDGPGSLRDAITQANNNPGADTINFNIPGPGPHTIKPRSALPDIDDPLTLDGTTQPGFAGAPVIELNGARLGAEEAALLITAGNSTIRGLVINRATDNIRIENGAGNIIEGNFLGTDSAGLAPPGPQSVGVYVSHSRGNVVGGTTQQARNIISGNDSGGVSLADSNENIVLGNFIGVDRTGSAALGNGGNGVDITGSNNTIGGTIAGARNVISGNGADGISVFEGPGNLIQGNLIGTDSSGNNALGNRGSGVLLLESADTIGGTVVSARNIISGNGVQGTGSEGVAIIGRDTARTQGNKVQGNFVGTDVTGARALSNFGNGVATTDVVDTIIGGATGEARNVISGNTGDGVAIGVRLSGRSGGTKIIVQGNFIGTDAAGANAIGNENGVLVDADSVTNTIQGNQIAFNRSNGVVIPDNNNPGVRIAIVSNSIYSNGLLGIDLGSPGATPNDDKDVDLGANELQNFPILTSATASGTSTLASTLIIAAVRASIGGTFNSTPNARFTLEFFFGTQCSPSEPQAVGMVPIPLTPILQLTTDNNGNAAFSYEFDFPSGVTRGVVICTATDSRGNTSEQSPCFAVALPSCPPTISPTAGVFGASGGSDAVNVFASAGCAWAARSNDDWISITSGTSGTTSGVVTYSVAANSGNNVRSGTMTIAEQTFTVTEQGRTPVINDALREGKKLIVTGERFDDGARILINGEPQKTANDPDSLTTRLIGKKAGKLIIAGDRLQVRNADGGLSPEFIYRGSSASTSASRRL